MCITSLCLPSCILVSFVISMTQYRYRSANTALVSIVYVELVENTGQYHANTDRLSISRVNGRSKRYNRKR